MHLDRISWNFTYKFREGEGKVEKTNSLNMTHHVMECISHHTMSLTELLFSPSNFDNAIAIQSNISLLKMSLK